MRIDSDLLFLLTTTTVNSRIPFIWSQTATVAGVITFIDFVHQRL